jgi:hypothetical protein
MPNTYLNSQLISKEAVAIFEAETSLIATGYKGDYEGMYANRDFKPGQTISVRMDNFFVGDRGDTITAEDIVEADFDLTIGDLYSIAIEYTPTDLQRDIANFGAEILKPAVRRLIAMMNTDIANGITTQVNYWNGDATAYLNSFAAVDQVNATLDEINANGYDRYLAISPKNAQTLRGALQNSFNTMLNEKITWKAALGNLADLDVMKDNSIGLHTAGTHTAAGDVIVKTDVSSGNTIVLDGFTEGATIAVGDPITLEGVKAYDNINRKALAWDMQFTVTAVSGAAGSNGEITVTVFPAIVADGPRQNFITPGADPNEIPANTVVTFIGDHVNNAAYTERGLITVIPPLQRMDSPDSYVMTDPKFGVSLRVSKTAEVLNNKNIMRLDGQMAFKWVPGQAVRLVSK